MGEARRRTSQGLPPKQRKPDPKDSERIVAWLPLTKSQSQQFVALTTRGAWIGIRSASGVLDRGALHWTGLPAGGPLADMP
jgi:hypothetical protein